MHKQLPKLALITPYDVLTDIVLRQAKGIFHCDVYYGFLDSAASIAEALDPDEYDIVLSRGGTAEYIKDHTSIPVVRILTSAADLLRTLLPYRGSIHKIAFFNYMEKLTGVTDIALALNIQIDEYVFQNYQDINDAMLKCKKEKYDFIIGGSPALSIASEYGLEGVLIESGYESVSSALRESKAIVETLRKKNSAMARFERVLSSIAEGIIVTNEHNQIVTFNKMAQEIIGLNESDALGKPVENVIKNTRIHEVLLSKAPEIGELQDVGTTTIVTNRIPIMIGDHCIGVVCSFTDTPRIKKAEKAIQSQIKKIGFAATYSFNDILTTNEGMKKVIKLANIYAKTDSPVLIYGDSGTGKEMFAQSIHVESQRASGPFVAINCAAIPEQLIESELFGYEGGAFTGARKEGKEGLIELAHNGTFFLDEVAELPLQLQTRLLRVLQEYVIMRVGGKELIPVNIRVIVASNKNLKTQINKGEFRADLYYRLNVLPLSIPPLRERTGDIEYLARHFLPNQKQMEKMEAFVQDVADYNWPGNIRELKAVIDRLVLLSDSFPKLSWLELLKLTSQGEREENKESNDVNEKNDTLIINLTQGDLKEIITDAEQQVIQHYLQVFNDDQNKVMNKLGISKMSLWRKLNQKK